MRGFNYQILILWVFFCGGILGQSDTDYSAPDYNPDIKDESDLPVEARDNTLPHAGLTEMSNNFTSHFASILQYIQEGNRNCEEIESRKITDIKSGFQMLNITLGELKVEFAREHGNIMEHSTDFTKTLESTMKNLSKSCSEIQSDRSEILRMDLKIDQIQENIAATKEDVNASIREEIDSLKEFLLPKFQSVINAEILFNVSSVELKNIINDNQKDVEQKLELLTTAVQGGNSEQNKNRDQILEHLESLRVAAGNCNITMPELRTALNEQGKTLENMMQSTMDELNRNTNKITRDDFQELNSTQTQIKNLVSSLNELIINHHNFLNKSSSSIQNEIQTCTRNADRNNLELQKLDLKFQNGQQTIVAAIKNLEDKFGSLKTQHVSHCESFNASQKLTSDSMEQFQLMLKNKTDTLEMMIQVQITTIINATEENKELLESIVQNMETMKGIAGIGDHQTTEDQLFVTSHSKFFNSTLNETIGSLIQYFADMTEKTSIECINADKRVEGIQSTLDTVVIKNQRLILKRLDTLNENLNKDQAETNLKFIEEREAFDSKLKSLEESIRNCSGSHQTTQQKLQNLENKLTNELISSKLESINQFEDLKKNMKFGMETLAQQFQKVYEEIRELKSNLTRTAASVSSDEESTQGMRIKKHVDDPYCANSCAECRKNCDTEEDCHEPWICTGCELHCAIHENIKFASVGTSQQSSSIPGQLPRIYYNNHHAYDRGN